MIHDEQRLIGEIEFAPHEAIEVQQMHARIVRQKIALLHLAAIQLGREQPHLGLWRAFKVVANGGKDLTSNESNTAR